MNKEINNYSKSLKPVLYLKDANGKVYDFYLVLGNETISKEVFFQYEDEPLIKRIVFKPRVAIFYLNDYAGNKSILLEGDVSKKQKSFYMNSKTNIVEVNFINEEIRNSLIDLKAIGFSYDMAKKYGLDIQKSFDIETRRERKRVKQLENN